MMISYMNSQRFLKFTAVLSFTIMLVIPILAIADSLTDYVKIATPWLAMAPDSEQRQPIYLGATPVEMELMGAYGQDEFIHLPAYLRETGSAQLHAIYYELVKRQSIKSSAIVEVEAWPARSPVGKLIWALTRWRQPTDDWQWLDTSFLPSTSTDILFLPQLLKALVPDAKARIFNDPLQFNDLYMKPVFGNCVWTNETGAKIYSA